MKLVNGGARARMASLVVGGAMALARAAADDGAEAEELSRLEDYLQRALAANPGLAAFESRYRAAMQRIPQAAALPDPVFQVTHFVEPVQTRVGPQENAFALSQRIPWLGKLGAAARASSAEASALWHAYQSRQLDLVRAVGGAYYEYGYVELATQLTSETAALLAGLEPIAEERVKTGEGLNALLHLKLELGKVRDRQHVLEQKRFSLSARLRALLALDGVGVLPWPAWDAPDLALPNVSELLRAMEEGSPELRMLEDAMKSAEARSELAKLERRPDFTVGANYIQTGDLSGPSATAGSGEDAWGITVGLSIPVWGKRTGGARAEALASEQAARSEYESRANELRAEMRERLSALADAERRMALYGEELMELAEQAAENSRSGYRSGTASLVDLIDSERSLLELKLLYWRAAADASQQFLAVRALANRPLLDNIGIDAER